MVLTHRTLASRVEWARSRVGVTIGSFVDGVDRQVATLFALRDKIAVAVKAVAPAAAYDATVDQQVAPPPSLPGDASAKVRAGLEAVAEASEALRASVPPANAVALLLALALSVFAFALNVFAALASRVLAPPQATQAPLTAAAAAVE